MLLKIFQNLRTLCFTIINCEFNILLYDHHVIIKLVFIGVIIFIIFIIYNNNGDNNNC